MSFQNHLHSAKDLVTSYEEVRAGFIRLALEKNRQATPFIEEAKTLKALALQITKPADLLNVEGLRPAILTAAGVSDKARNYLTKDDQFEAIKGLVDTFLEPAGKNFVDELVFRFLLTRGDALGGRMRNIAGVLAEHKLTRVVISTLSLQDKPFSWLNVATRSWQTGSKAAADIERFVRGLHWESSEKQRLLIYNLNVPVVKKNIDLCLLEATPAEISVGKRDSIHYQSNAYLALGELKGGIDPAGADEHWKTANTALTRVRNAFAAAGHTPHTFFIGAAIAPAMAEEIFSQLQNGQMSNTANLTSEQQLASLCQWLVNL
ncbi:MAG: AvaI/BsoBI family type II restriction endonuclease [Caldilineaceae bacterium]